MIYVIMNRAVSRDPEADRRPRLRGTALILGAAAAGAACGSLLGWIGSAVPVETRAAVGAVLALAAVCIGVYEVVARRRLRVPQIDRETNQQWLSPRPVLGALATGAVIGAGFATRIGFWSWYVVPAGCLLVGRADAGAAIYATYAVTRAATPVLLSTWAALRGASGDEPEISAYGLQERMMRLTRPIPVHALSAFCLVIIACAYLAT